MEYNVHKLHSIPSLSDKTLQSNSHRRLFSIVLTPGVFLILSLLSLILTSPIVSAGHLPLWELGAGLGYLHAPHYRGSQQSEDYFLPFPYAVYRGEKLKADREGIRGELLKWDHANVDLSFAGNVPVSSNTEGARSGMPGLDLVLEIGPSANFELWTSKRNNLEQNFVLKMPFRPVVSIGDPIMEYQGIVFSPYFQLQNRIHYPKSQWRFNISAGPMFATERYHDYFYEVEAKYATAQRSEYDAKGGYSGSRVTISFTRNAESFYIGAFARYDVLDSAAFVDSPLIETDRYLVFGVAISWIMTHSEQTATHSSPLITH